MTDDLPPLGAMPMDASRTRFCVWAPAADRLTLLLPDAGGRYPLERDGRGYYTAVVEAGVGTRYQYEFDDGRVRLDPASRAQPDGVHGPSMVVDSRSHADAPFTNRPLPHHVLYELHVGTFTPAGTFDGVIERLDDLVELGVTAIELMPIGQFPGGRNWGYDGVLPFAAQWSYGGVEGLRRLVGACHRRTMAVVLDVVYNHLGPEGNYLRDFGPYFTDRYKTSWGEALNFDGPHADHVRELFIQSALHWVEGCGVDGLRLDAVHAIVDHTARTFVEELTARVHAAAEKSGRRVLVIAESNDNDPRLVRSTDAGGLGLDGCWNDDYHHAVRCMLTGERRGYYKPYGRPAHVAKAVRDRFVFTGQYSSGFERRHGADAHDVPHGRLVVYTQNHDQVGNRPFGDRLDQTAGAGGARVAAALVLLSPFTPMLWMGEEYAETAPFAYFISHTDPQLIKAVREGRRREFAEFQSGGEPPDPQDETTFRASRLDWAHRYTPTGRARLALYRELLRLRGKARIVDHADDVDAFVWEGCVVIVYGNPVRLAVVANPHTRPITGTLPVDRFSPPTAFRIALDTSSPAFRDEAEAGLPATGASMTSIGADAVQLTLGPRAAAVILPENPSS